jgi:hypothetical protein
MTLFDLPEKRTGKLNKFKKYKFEQIYPIIEENFQSFLSILFDFPKNIYEDSN